MIETISYLLIILALSLFVIISFIIGRQIGRVEQKIKTQMSIWRVGKVFDAVLMSPNNKKTMNYFVGAGDFVSRLQKELVITEKKKAKVRVHVR